MQSTPLGPSTPSLQQRMPPGWLPAQQRHRGWRVHFQRGQLWQHLPRHGALHVRAPAATCCALPCAVCGREPSSSGQQQRWCWYLPRLLRTSQAVLPGTRFAQCTITPSARSRVRSKGPGSPVWEFGSIYRMARDGGSIALVARGVRNTVGFDWHPDTGRLYFTDNGRDSEWGFQLQSKLSQLGCSRQPAAGCIAQRMCQAAQPFDRTPILLLPSWPPVRLGPDRP